MSFIHWKVLHTGKDEDFAANIETLCCCSVFTPVMYPRAPPRVRTCFQQWPHPWLEFLRVTRADLWVLKSSKQAKLWLCYSVGGRDLGPAHFLTCEMGVDSLAGLRRQLKGREHRLCMQVRSPVLHGPLSLNRCTCFTPKYCHTKYCTIGPKYWAERSCKWALCPEHCGGGHY